MGDLKQKNNILLKEVRILKNQNNKLQTAMKPFSDVCKNKFKNKSIKERHEEILHEREQTEKFSCSKCDCDGETDKTLDTHIVLKHFKVNLNGAQQLDKYECSECADYFSTREALINHVKKRGKCKLNI